MFYFFFTYTVGPKVPQVYEVFLQQGSHCGINQEDDREFLHFLILKFLLCIFVESSLCKIISAIQGVHAVAVRIFFLLFSCLGLLEKKTQLHTEYIFS